MDSRTEAGRKEDKKRAHRMMCHGLTRPYTKRCPWSSLGKEQTELFLETAMFVPPEGK
jgi:hypothetical protein